MADVVNKPDADTARIPVLDHGFVRLIDVMGDDAAIVQAARVSYGKGTKTTREDRGLIRYLMRHAHTTPFEMVEFKFHVKLPIFVARQWIRHRTANVNEYSARYSMLTDEFYVPATDRLAPQSTSNRQGSEETPLDEAARRRILDIFQDQADRQFRAYEELIALGLTRELARMVLGTNIYTEWYWKIDLHNLFHFLRLRLDPHAQQEIRLYAAALADLARPRVPLAFEAFTDFQLEGVRLSAAERELVRRQLTHGDLDVMAMDETTAGRHGLSARELTELRGKFSEGYAADASV